MGGAEGSRERFGDCEEWADGGESTRGLPPAPPHLSYSLSAQVTVLLTCRRRANGRNGSPAKWTG